MAFGDSGNLNMSDNNTPSGTGVLTRPAPKDRIQQNPKQRNRGTSNRPIPQAPQRVAAANLDWNRPRSYEIMKNVDTMLSKTRFAAVYSFYDTKGTAFKFKPSDMAGMINAGIMAYGKVGETGYRVPTVGVNVNALDQFLRDNYNRKGTGAYQRVKKNLALSDTFKEKAASSTAAFDLGRRDINPAAPVALLEDTPKKAIPGGEEYDYTKMAEQYVKDEDKYATLTGKILKKIAKEGGNAVLQNIQENGATPENIAALKEYMYSSDGEYGKPQMRWIDETFLGGQGKQAIADAARAASDMDQRKYLYDARVKEQAKLEKEQQKAIEDTTTTFFNTDPNKGAIIPKSSWLNNVVSLTAAGTGDMVSSAALNEIFYSNVAKGEYKNLSDSQKQAVYASVISALSNENYVHPFMYSRALQYEQELKDKNLLPDQVAALENVKAQANTDYLTSPFTKSVGQIPGVGPAIVATGLIGGVTADQLNEGIEAGPLSATPLKDGFSIADLGANALKGVVRSTISMPQGIYYGAIDPKATVKAIGDDYKYRYGSLEGFKNSAYEDPLMPIMDALSVISFTGTVFKGAQVARIAAAAKSNKVAIGMPEIDMAAYNTQIDDWLNTPAAERTGELRPPSAFETEAPTISVREYARIARQAALGDEGAAMRLGTILNNSDMGLNSAYVPTTMDKAAAFFEPRYRLMTQQEGAPERKTALADRTIDVLQETIPDSPRAARIRFAGNPLARGIQKVNFYGQRQVSKTPGALPQLLATLPGGYQFRFTRALREGDPAVLDLHAREMIYNRMFSEDFNNLDMNEAEQLAVMDLASGEMYSPTNLRTIAFKRIERAKKYGINPADDPVIAMAERDYKLFSDPSFVREYEKAKREMHGLEDGVITERGDQLRAAAQRMILLREKTSHLINHSWDDSRATRAMQLRYQVAMEAADLMPDSVFKEIGKRVSKIVKMNSVYHLYEINRADVMDLPDENGVALKDTPGVDASDIKAIVDQVEASLEYLRTDLGNRTKGGTPVLVIEEEAPALIGNRDFVVARRVRVDGDLAPDAGIISRDGLLDKQELLLPKEFFVTTAKGKRKGRIEYWDNKKENEFGFTPAQERLNELVLNEMEALFPNARDFTDKVSTESLGVRESFADRKNFNKAVASGVLDFRYQIQVAAHAAAVRSRFKNDIEQLINAQSEIIAVQDFDPTIHQALRTAKVYNSRKLAENALRASGREGGTIQEVTLPSGERAYVTNVSYFDVTAATMKEMRLRRILKWDEDVADNYFEAISEIKTLDPNSAIVVVPKYFANNIGRSYKRSENLGMKILDQGTDFFKVLTLSMNPRFVPQQVIGSAVMLMMAYPDKAAPVMAKVLEYATRQSHNKISKIVDGDSAEFLNHSTDYMVMEEYMPRDVTESLFQQDMLSTAERKLPSKVARYIMNSGYLIAFAWEKNLRVALGRKMAMNYPGFESFAKTKIVKDFAKGDLTIPGMAPSMYKTNSPFAAAFKLLADPDSPYYDPMFLREVRHGTDMVAGNYRDFTTFERNMRNFLVPFYAWTRHSAMFTKRMVQERPLTTNALAWVGNYGYDKTLETGGLPEWLLETIPMPQFLENILDLNPLMDNRVGVGGIMPFGTFGSTVAAGSNLAFGHKFGTSQATDFMSPFVVQGIEQQTGRSLLTGAPVADKGIVETIVDGFQGYPVIGAVVNLFKNESQLNTMRGRENPEDIFVDVDDPNSKLSIPSNKLSTKFETDSNAGAFNLFSPARAYSLDPAGIDKMVSEEFKKAGIKIPSKNSIEYKGVFETINSLQRWKRKRDFVLNNYVPMFQESNPELVLRAQEQLAAEFPEIPKSTPPGLVEKVLNGYITLPGGG